MRFILLAMVLLAVKESASEEGDMAPFDCDDGADCYVDGVLTPDPVCGKYNKIVYKNICVMVCIEDVAAPMDECPNKNVSPLLGPDIKLSPWVNNGPDPNYDSRRYRS